MSKSNHSKRYADEFKRDAVELAPASGKTVTEVARDPGVSPEGLRTCGTGRSRRRPTAGKAGRAS
ncbi:transposase [Streptomyces incanus]|uniref:Transposase n=1 Tax=Streptomyces incanus TaxID=887453 RepID=A0ABW0XJM9_9ACTN